MEIDERQIASSRKSRRSMPAARGEDRDERAPELNEMFREK